MKQNNFKSLVLYVSIMILFSSCHDEEKEQQLMNDVTTAENNYKLVKDEYDALLIKYNELSELSVVEKEGLEAQLIELNNQLSSQEEQLAILRSQNIADGQEDYVSAIIEERDRLARLLQESQEKNATLEGTIARLEVDFNAKSKKYVEEVSSTLIQVYEDLLDITEQKSIIAKDLKRYDQGTKEINIASSIKSSLEIVRQRLDNTKTFIEMTKQNSDPLNTAISEQFDRANERVTKFEEEIRALENIISAMREELNEANKACLLIETRQELKNGNILEKSGIFGFGKLQFNIENVGTEKCTVVDKRGDLLVIPHQGGQNPVILTNHPKFSYSIKKQGSTVSILSIRNPKSFWSLSNTLVISLE